MSFYLRLFTFILLLGTIGCVSYAPAPVVFDTVTPIGLTSLTEGDVRSHGIKRNASLTELLASIKAAQDVHVQTGYYEDPTLSMDLMRNLTSDRYLGGISLGFEIPLNGLPELEVEAAKRTIERLDRAYHDQAGRVILTLDTATSQLYYSTQLVSAQEDRLVELTKQFTQVQGLYQVGEVPVTMLRGLETEIVRQKQTLAEARRTERANQDIVTALLLPSVDEVLSFDLNTRSALTSLQSLPADLTAHPTVRVALAEYAESEVALQMAIAQQYPSLSLGPALGREDGENKIGLGVGITLPLWNRNRVAIAEQTGERSTASIRTLNSYLTLTAAYNQARNALAYADDALADANDAVSSAKKQADQSRLLFSLGEESIDVLLGSTDVVHEMRINHMNTIATVDRCRIDLNYFTLTQGINR